MIKRLIALAIVFLMSINSFAAVVSDNDGSAFITKAEFDSLKSSFQSQINQYQTSIDNKIDGAIAAYLAGIKIDTQDTNLWENITTSLGQKLKMRNSMNSGTNDTTTAVNVSYSRYHDIYESTDVKFYLTTQYNTSDKFDHGRQEGRISRIYSGGEYINMIITYDATGGHGYMGGAWPWVAYETYLTTTTGGSWINNGQLGTNYSYAWQRYSSKGASTVDGSGKRWVYHKNPNGDMYLMTFNTAYYANIVGEAIYKASQGKSTTWNIDSKHAIGDFAKYMTDGSRKDDGEKTVTISLDTDEKFVKDGNYVIRPGTYSSYDDSSLSGGGTRSGVDKDHFENYKGVYTRAGSTYTLQNGSANDSMWVITYNTVKTSDGEDYTLDQWGYGVTGGIYANQDTEDPIVTASKTQSLSATEFYSTYGTPVGYNKQTNKLGKLNFKYDEVKFKNELKEISTFTNTYLTSVAGEKVYIGGGAPLVRCNNDDGSTVKVKLKFEGVSGCAADETVKYVFSDKQFIKGSVDTAGGAKTLAEGEVKIGTEINKEFLDMKKNNVIWINFYAKDTNGAVVTIGDFTLKK